ncbi:helitron_like_N domain-containing protein [Trichonephila clavata]|uniref:Helitron_like_N domain-containing protein n=1 Tax=Trichonephila clavata TaxID=2740835 RepID=A0A8X6F4W9_TRICU|nr:helitron_like_N domain-containing protein [Trichonephila clavata]
MIILPSSYIGNPRHMQEYAQDAYVRYYGRPDLFITFMCNPAWDEIQQLLLLGQSQVDRHDITARVFRQKLKSLMDFIVKYEVFGSVCCWMYSVEWQKRGLPHAHILIWLYNKITSDEIDDVISAEIPRADVDKDLHAVIIKNMIHGPCGTLNPNSPCMVDGKCSKKYPRAFTANMITGDDGYPRYRRRSTEDGGNSAAVHMQNGVIEVDNRWVVTYSALLSKTYRAHINVEYCNSVKSIKYICKYVNKGSDMAVFGVQPENSDRNAVPVIDEIAQYQAGRYISSNEAAWRIFSFPMHERNPAVIHLSIHLENGQCVYFTDENVLQRALNPPGTTLTAFFTLCQEDAFARTLLYSEVPSYYTWNETKKGF